MEGEGDMVRSQHGILEYWILDSEASRILDTSILRLGAGTSEIKFNRCSRVCEPAPNLYRALE